MDKNEYGPKQLLWILFLRLMYVAAIVFSLLSMWLGTDPLGAKAVLSICGLICLSAFGRQHA
jgi:flagellar basal body-associated protein FliL